LLEYLDAEGWQFLTFTVAPEDERTCRVYQTVAGPGLTDPERAESAAKYEMSIFEEDLDLQRRALSGLEFPLDVAAELWPAEVLSEPVRVRGAVAQSGTAELDGRARHPPPERPDGWRYPKLDAGHGMPAHKIVDNNLIDCVHRLVGDPVAAHIVGPERPGWQPVSVEAAISHALQPAGFHDVDPVRGALPEEPFTVLRRGGRHRPDASSRTVPREPEHGCMTGINCPYQG